MQASCLRWAMAFVGSRWCLLPVPATVPAAVPSSFFFAKAFGAEDGIRLLTVGVSRKKVESFAGIRTEQPGGTNSTFDF